jgi:uncharacterized protein YhfF
MIGEKTAEVEAFVDACRARGITVPDGYFVGTFAEPALAPYHDELVELVGAGMKRATAHLALDFTQNGIARRGPGDPWLVVDSANTPRFLVRVTDVTEWPFNEVPESFAAREGEGDLSLDYWRRVHRDYFTQQCAKWGVPFREDLTTVCEGFELLA